MLDAQRQTSGDGLDHGFDCTAICGRPSRTTTEADFLQLPVLFGMLFGLGLYARVSSAPGRVRRNDTNRLLSRTGMADAATLAADFGIDVRSKAFWKASLEHDRQGCGPVLRARREVDLNVRKPAPSRVTESP